jgi:hypothetical protein
VSRTSRAPLTVEPLSMQSARGRDSVLSAADYLFKNGVIEKPVGTDFLAST